MLTENREKWVTVAINIIVLALAITSITDPTLIGINPAHWAWIVAVLNILLRFLRKGPQALMPSETQPPPQGETAAKSSPLPR